MAITELESIPRVWGRNPRRGQRAQPLVRRVREAKPPEAEGF